MTAPDVDAVEGAPARSARRRAGCTRRTGCRDRSSPPASGPPRSARTPVGAEERRLGRQDDVEARCRRASAAVSRAISAHSEPAQQPPQAARARQHATARVAALHVVARRRASPAPERARVVAGQRARLELPDRSARAPDRVRSRSPPARARRPIGAGDHRAGARPLGRATSHDSCAPNRWRAPRLPIARRRRRRSAGACTWPANAVGRIGDRDRAARARQSFDRPSWS